MSDNSLKVAVVMILVALTAGAFSWVVVGPAARRRRWQRMRDAGTGTVVIRVITGVLVVLGTASIMESHESFGVELASMLALCACLTLGAILGSRAASQRYPEDYELMRSAKPTSDPVIHRQIIWTIAKPMLWSLVPGFLLTGVVRLVWG